MEVNKPKNLHMRYLSQIAKNRNKMEPGKQLIYEDLTE
uniref:Uncharacterized protein n=1 Tax=Rhizophora mucronata TaxID=61149 RepID=A0A2P2QU24_RHIMU